LAACADDGIVAPSTSESLGFEDGITLDLLGDPETVESALATVEIDLAGADRIGIDEGGRAAAATARDALAAGDRTGRTVDGPARRFTDDPWRYGGEAELLIGRRAVAAGAAGSVHETAGGTFRSLGGRVVSSSPGPRSSSAWTRGTRRRERKPGAGFRW